MLQIMKDIRRQPIPTGTGMCIRAQMTTSLATLVNTTRRIRISNKPSSSSMFPPRAIQTRMKRVRTAMRAPPAGKSPALSKWTASSQKMKAPVQSTTFLRSLTWRPFSSLIPASVCSAVRLLGACASFSSTTASGAVRQSARTAASNSAVCAKSTNAGIVCVMSVTP